MARLPKKALPTRAVNHYLMMLVPVILVVLLFTSMILHKAESAQSELVQTQVHAIADEIEQQFLSYYENANALVAEETLRYENMVTKPEKSLKGLNTLRLAREYCGAYDVFLDYGAGRMYSANGITSAEPYFLSMLRVTEAEKTRAMDAFAQQQRCVLLLEGRAEAEDVILLYCPTYRPYDRSYDIAVGYCVKTGALCGQLNDAFLGQSVQITLTFGDGKQIHFAIGKNGKLQQMEVETSTDDGQVIITEQMPFTGITMAVGYDSDELFADVRHLQMLCFVTLAIALLVSVTLAVWFGLRRARQVNRLETLVRDKEDPSGESKSAKSDEFAAVRSSIMRMMEEWEGDRTDNRTYRFNLKERTAELLFYGLCDCRKNDVYQLLKRCGVELTDPCFYIGGILLDSDNEVFELTKNVFEGDLFCEYHFGDRRALFYLAGLPDLDYTCMQRETNTSRLKNVLEQFGGQNVCFYISRVVKDLGMVHVAFTETVQLMEKLLQTDENRWINFCENQLCDNHVILLPNQSLLTQFREALTQCNKQAALKVFEKMEREMAVSANSDENRAYLRFCILQEMLQTELPTEQQAELQELVLHVPTTSEEAFHEHVYVIVGRYFSENADVKINFDRVMNYINQHYREYDISLEKIASNFGVNKSYLSKLFHQRTGMNYIDYLTERRMREIKRMLTETDEPIASIFESVGYVNKTNYSKKIKAFFGMSASELRRTYRAGNGEETEAEAESANILDEDE